MNHLHHRPKHNRFRLVSLLALLLLLGACNRQLSAESLANERRALQREITALRAEADSLSAANEEMRTRVAELMVLLETQQEELRSRVEAVESSAQTVQERSTGLEEQVESAGEAAEASQEVVDQALEQAAQEELETIDGAVPTTTPATTAPTTPAELEIQPSDDH